MSPHRLSIVGIAVSALGISGDAFAQGSERAIEDGLHALAAIVAVVFAMVVVVVWVAAAYHRARAWLAHVFTALILGIDAAMAWVWAAEVWLVWASMFCCIVAPVVGLQERRRRLPPTPTVPRATVARSVR